MTLFVHLLAEARVPGAEHQDAAAGLHVLQERVLGDLPRNAQASTAEDKLADPEHPGEGSNHVHLWVPQYEYSFLWSS
eukprot:2343737-Pyramimonas_sp.AAC.1